MVPSFLDPTTLKTLIADGGVPRSTWSRRSLSVVKKCPEMALSITQVEDAALRNAAETLMQQHPDPASLPLLRVPFAVKDNIDVAGLSTTRARLYGGTPCCCTVTT